jgi:hypothetical protein
MVIRKPETGFFPDFFPDTGAGIGWPHVTFVIRFPVSGQQRPSGHPESGFWSPNLKKHVLQRKRGPAVGVFGVLGFIASLPRGALLCTTSLGCIFAALAARWCALDALQASFVYPRNDRLTIKQCASNSKNEICLLQRHCPRHPQRRLSCNHQRILRCCVRD